MLPVLIYAAWSVHASPALATVVVAINGFGTFLFDFPAGRIVARFGEWRSPPVSCASAGHVPRSRLRAHERHFGLLSQRGSGSRAPGDR